LKSIRRRIIRRIVNDTRCLEVSGRGIDPGKQVEASVEFNIIQEQASGELSQQLSSALAHLSGRQREAVYLRFYEKMDYAQISEVMNLSLKSSYKLMGKAIDTLRKALR
jgi:RNA polymerase sigma factor (sigma-70 family)